ncbi:hypothetical protein vseg_010026 [Gypsophila vaccaria]
MATSAISLWPLRVTNNYCTQHRHDLHTAISFSNIRSTTTIKHPQHMNMSFRLFASSSDVLESQEFGSDSFQGEESQASSLGIGADSSEMAPKQKIRIKLRSYWVPLIEDSCKQIMDAAMTTNAKTMGPVPLPTKKRIYCVLKSPHVHKDARFHFEIRTHQRLIDILYPTAQTIDSLMQLDLPAGVDVEVKL